MPTIPANNKDSFPQNFILGSMEKALQQYQEPQSPTETFVLSVGCRNLIVILTIN